MNLEKEPKVSIIMGIYNCELTIAESIESIINQTYTNWELIMCDDFSKDKTFEIAKSYENKYPQKIKVIKNKRNLTLGPTLNKCIDIASGEYIARQDADDISHKDRIKIQVEFLENNKDIDLVGSNMKSFNELGEQGTHCMQAHPQKFDLVKGVTFAHPTIMIKSEVMKNLNGYCIEEYAKQLEDYELWIRFFKEGYKGENLDKSLYFYREDDDAYKRRNIKRRIRQIKLKSKMPKSLGLATYTYLFIIKDIIALFIPSSIFKNYYKYKLKNN
jgi:glycosyltransferase EpsE